MAESAAKPEGGALSGWQADFPRLNAITQRFTLGLPRNFAISKDGSQVFFLRSPGPSDPTNCLWVLQVASGEETLLVDPANPFGEGVSSSGASGGNGAELPEAEKARRERARESAGGIVSFSTDDSGLVLTFTLGGELFVVDARSLAFTNGSQLAASVEIRRIELGGVESDQDEPGQDKSAAAISAGAFDPRLSPDASQLSFVVGDSLWIAAADGSRPGRPLLEPDASTEVSWGRAEFIAAEEMRRSRGHWWSPNNDALAVARVDETPVQQWHIADPANPEHPPRVLRYPAAGTANADVQLFVIGVDDAASVVQVQWDARAFPYLCDVSWETEAGLRLVVQSRDQRELRVLEANPQTGEAATLASQTNPDWVELVPGAPAFTPFGLLTVAQEGGTRTIALDGKPLTAPDQWVRAIVNVEWAEDELTVHYLASLTPADVVLYRRTLSDAQAQVLSRASGGIATAVCRAGTCVISQAALDSATEVTVLTGGQVASGQASTSQHSTSQPSVRQAVVSHAADPFEAHQPQVELHLGGEREVPTAVVWPQTVETTAPLPILLDPYGGPHAQRVVSARSAYGTSQWFANQGFCVVIADGRGTPGRTGNWEKTDWERAVKGDLAGPVLTDQLSALDFVIDEFGDRVNPNAVGIRGWSFGGFLAALAVLRRPDRFHAAVAGAPVTDWALYDTHYTERYLGDPATEPENYRRSSLFDQLPEIVEEASQGGSAIKRPLMLIHGLADDNVVAAHTLKLSGALLANGHPHEVLPLTGVTHMTPQVEVAQNLLLAQLDFLQRHLRPTPTSYKN